MTDFLSNRQGVPEVFFHFSWDDINVNKFKPFTHFGTCQAAHERWAGLGMANPGARFYPCLLNIKNPLRVKDSGDLDIFFGIKQLIDLGVLPEKLEWIYQPLLMNPVDRNLFFEAAKTAHSYCDFDPNVKMNSTGFVHDCFHRAANLFRHKSIYPISFQTVMSDLENLSIFPLDLLPNTITTPKFGVNNSVYFEQEDVREKTARRWLKDQRKIIVLEELGYDSLVYKNREEDFGKDSYCIFRSSQVASAISYNWGQDRPQIKINFDHYRFYWPEIYDPAAP